MVWKELEYSRTEIIDAGKVIRDKCCSEQDIHKALQIIDNWRAAHAYPMHVIYMHLRRMSSSNNDIIVAERLKRLDSIISKLGREANMNLWTMQDLGGCRFIVPTLKDVTYYSNKYKTSSIRHLPKKEYDYILLPKSNGYRSLHLVFQYKSDKKDTYNRNMLIEIQFRTKLQHLWATAIETMGLFTNRNIKAGECDTNTLRFFALVSALFAIEEKTEPVPNTSNDKSIIIKELQELNRKHKYIDTLTAINVAANYIEPKITRSLGYILLIIDLKKKTLSFELYKSSESERALVEYNTVEQSHDVQKSDAVLVRVSSFTALKLAYPNYFSDISSFLQKVKNYLIPSIMISFN